MVGDGGNYAEKRNDAIAIPLPVQSNSLPGAGYLGRRDRLDPRVESDPPRYGPESFGAPRPRDRAPGFDEGLPPARWLVDDSPPDALRAAFAADRARSSAFFFLISAMRSASGTSNRCCGLAL